MPDSLRKLSFEPTSRCNLNCAMCFRTAWRDEALTDMDMSVFEAAIRTMPESVAGIMFGGMGEPLLHQEIFRMVAFAAETGRPVNMVTNATLLTPERSRLLLEAGLDTLWISMDSFEEKGYEAIRKGADFSMLLAHLREFNLQRKKIGRPTRLGVNFVVTRNNARQLALIPRFILQHKINEVNVSNLIPSDKHAEADMLYDRVMDGSRPYTGPASPKIHLPLMDWRQEGAIEGLKALLAFSSGVLSLAGQPISRRVNSCRFIEEGNAFVRHDGGVSPCMALLHNAVTYWWGRKRTIHRHAFGNVLSEGLDAIWNSAAYRRFRDRVRRFDFSPCMRCSGCENWESNLTDCFGNEKPVCGACLWSDGIISCP